MKSATTPERPPETGPEQPAVPAAPREPFSEPGPDAPSIAVYSLGCRANQFDGESVYAQFNAAGYRRVAEHSPADVHLINTCTVTNPGDAKSRQLVRKIARESALGGGTVIVTGCSAQQDAEGMLKEGAHLVVDNANKTRILDNFLEGRRGVVRSRIFKQREMEQTPIDQFGDKTRAHLKLQDGCNQYCSYCIIPFVRGRSRCLEPIQVLEQLQKLVKHGYREIVLTGIHIGHYDYQGFAFHQLLEQVLDTPGDFRVRLSSIEPREINGEILKLFEAYPEKLCRHLHVAIQSADSEVLERMRRPYDRAYLEDLFTKLYALDAGFGLGVDVIAGFPGETPEQFENTLKFLKRHPLAYGHMFRFSPKEGTPAAKYPNQIPETEKKRRSRLLRRAIAEGQRAFIRGQGGTRHQVLFETENSGYAGNYLRVKVRSPEDASREADGKASDSPGNRSREADGKNRDLGGELREVTLSPDFSWEEGAKFPSVKGELITAPASKVADLSTR